MKKLKLISQNMNSEKAVKLLAKTMYKELLSNGFSKKDIIFFCKEIVDNINFNESYDTVKIEKSFIK